LQIPFLISQLLSNFLLLPRHTFSIYFGATFVDIHLNSIQLSAQGVKSFHLAWNIPSHQHNYCQSMLASTASYWWTCKSQSLSLSYWILKIRVAAHQQAQAELLICPSSHFMEDLVNQSEMSLSTNLRCPIALTTLSKGWRLSGLILLCFILWLSGMSVNRPLPLIIVGMHLFTKIISSCPEILLNRSFFTWFDCYFIAYWLITVTRVMTPHSCVFQRNVYLHLLCLAVQIKGGRGWPSLLSPLLYMADVHSPPHYSDMVTGGHHPSGHTSTHLNMPHLPPSDRPINTTGHVLGHPVTSGWTIDSHFFCPPSILMSWSAGNFMG
jgi:hypothetical protein